VVDEPLQDGRDRFDAVARGTPLWDDLLQRVGDPLGADR
jgi:hypothetical protein